MLQTQPTYVDNAEGKKDVIPPNPYLKITQDAVTIYYQDGAFYGGEGEMFLDYNDIPDWFWNIIRRSYLTSEVGRKAIADFGLVLPEDRVLTKEEHDDKKVKDATALWKCTEDGCDEELPYNNRNLHLANHRKADLKKAKGKRRK